MKEWIIRGTFSEGRVLRSQVVATCAAMSAIIFLLCGLATGGQQSAMPSNQISELATLNNSSAPPEQLKIDGQVIGERVPAQAGEICLVCGKPTGKDDVVYLVNGHRVPLHAQVCYAAFNKNPYKYLAVIKPQGAFLGSGGEAHEVSFGWFFFGIYILIGLVFAALCAQRAVSTGHNPAAWFGIGLVLNAMGYLLLLAQPRGTVYAPAGVSGGFHKIPVTYSPVACPRCGTPNHPSARTCANCGAKLEAKIVSEVQKAAAR